MLAGDKLAKYAASVVLVVVAALGCLDLSVGWHSGYKHLLSVATRLLTLLLDCGLLLLEADATATAPDHEGALTAASLLRSCRLLAASCGFRALLCQVGLPACLLR